MEFDLVYDIPYVEDQFDRDNLALLFKARVALYYGINSVGVVIDDTSAHAYNIVLFSDAASAIFEPQSDKWPERGQDLYRFEKGLILL